MGRLTHNRLRFIAEYLATHPRNATRAYLAAYGGSEKTAGVCGPTLLKDPDVIAEIERREAQMLDDLELKAEDVLREIFLIATADPRELSEYHVGACRFCHGDQHRYHRTPAEYQRDLDDYMATSGKDDPLALSFKVKGGIGFNPYAEPHPDCPECFGKGQGYEVFKDTRNLSPGAARLYEGVKRTRDGLEIKQRSREPALQLAAQHLGIAKNKTELTGKDGGPIQTAGVTFEAVDPIQASQLYQSIMGG